MTKHSDPRFAKVVALMESTQHAGERANARKSAEDIAKSCGMTFEQARAQMNQPAPAVNFFHGFDDWMEDREPGYKAAKAAEKSAKERARLARKAAIIARYGSEEAALAPCAREQKICDELGARIKKGPPPFQRWTHELDGCKSAWHELSPSARLGVANAYALPTTFAAAREEYDYWRQRRDDMEDVLDGDFGDCGLDMTAEIRMDLVRDLVEHGLPTITLADLYARFRYYRDLESHCDKVEDALFRDLEAIVRSEGGTEKADATQRTPSADPSHPSTDPVDAHPSTSDRDRRIQTMLDANPQQSDRTIARVCKCSPTTVGKIRRDMGLQQAVRSVQRGGQMYQMTLDLEARA